MFCGNCGAQLPAGAEMCTQCGMRPTRNQNFCNNCGVNLQPNQEMCVKCGVKINRDVLGLDPNTSSTLKQPIVAALLSFVIPGLGQIILGQVKKGIVVLIGGGILAVITSFFTFGLGPILIWGANIFDAYQIATKVQNGKTVGEWEFF